MTLGNPQAFFDVLRAGLLGPTLSQDEVDGCEAILQACVGWPIAWTAYALATAWHETASTMQPIKEYGGAAYFFRMYDIMGARPKVARALGNIREGDGVRFAGRGYVQLTGRANYKRASASLELGDALVEAPARALDPAIAAQIMRQGMSQGWFTGVTLAETLPGAELATREQFREARRIINGRDRADDIAGHALAFQDALARGRWGENPELAGLTAENGESDVA